MHVFACALLCTARSHLAAREKEDSLRWLFAKQRAHPGLADLHIGLEDVHGDGFLAKTLRENSQKAAAGSTRMLDIRDTARQRYPVVFDELYPHGLLTTVITQTKEETLGRFEKHHPKLLDCLREAPSTAEVGWFIAGGSVLRCLMAHKKAERLFNKSDVDIFVYARGEDGSAKATELAWQIVRALYLPRDGEQERYSYSDPTLTRTLWTLNLEHVRVSVQVILRVYHSPSEVLCGFDIDACCVGFGADGVVWALPRAMHALLSGRTVLNPLHAWPRQPSYELRLAKYAARGFVVACPGLFTPPKPADTLRWKTLSRHRLIQLRGAARLLHMDMALGLPENKGFSTDHGPGPGYRGTDNAPANWQAAIRRTFETEATQTVLSSGHRDDYEIPLKTLPTDMAQVQEIIDDPYGWIEQYYLDRPRGVRARESSVVGDALLKLHRVTVGCGPPPPTPDPQPPYYRQPRGEVTDATLETAWANLLDVGHDRLAIPRVLKWSILPRSREYMNMEAGYSHLWRAYQRTIFRDDAATAEPSEPEYGEPFMEWYRDRCAGRAAAGGSASDDDDDCGESYDEEEDFDDDDDDDDHF